MSKVKSTAAYVAVLGMLAFNGLCLSAFAQQGGGIQIEDSGIDWTQLPGQIISALMGPVIVGIGIGLSIWVVIKGVRLFRRSAS